MYMIFERINNGIAAAGGGWAYTIVQALPLIMKDVGAKLGVLEVIISPILMVLAPLARRSSQDQFAEPETTPFTTEES